MIHIAIGFGLLFLAVIFAAVALSIVRGDWDSWFDREDGE